MHKYRSAALAGLAALCVAGAAFVAMDHTHAMQVDLPDGSVARIEYQGVVAPHVRIEPAVPLEPVAIGEPFAPSLFDPFGRLAADLDHEADDVVRHVIVLEPQATSTQGQVGTTSLATLPPGIVSYRYISTGDGKSACTYAWQIISQGERRSPGIMSAGEGDCARSGRQEPAHGTDAPMRGSPVTSASSAV